MKYTILINQYAAVNSGLDLDLIDLAIFDFIKDFANCASCVKMHTPEGIYFWISHKLILEAMPLLNIKTSQGMIKRIDNLIKAGILQKHPNCELYNKTLYCFGENYELLTFTEKAARILTGVDTPKQKLMPPLNESLGVPLNESLGYNSNNIDNTINDNENTPNNNVVGELFPEEQKEVQNDKKRTSIFRNSDVYKLVKFGADGVNDYSEFEKLFATPEFEKVDLIYYFHTVADWSETKQGVKRTRTGWIATVRNFIRGDIEKKKLHLKPEYQAPQKQLNVAGAMEFLNNDY